MRFLVPLFDCFFISENCKKLNKDIAYSISSFENKNLLISDLKSENLFYLDFNNLDKNKNLLIVKFENKEYVFLFQQKKTISSLCEIKYQNNSVLVGCGDCLNISYNGKIIVNEQLQLEYSHYEILNGLCIIYFKGQRNFVVVLENEVLHTASFYDEHNRNGNELYFMCKCFDSLNHGKVIHINNGKYEEYLVYLDDFDLKLKSEFVANVFIDSVMTGNFKYANHLLCDELKQKDENLIKDFFLEFDYCFFSEENVCIIIKKNTLSGVYKFEVLNNKISNIIQIC